MTNEQKLKRADTNELAKLLYDFASGFYTESIDGLCDIECKQSKDSCNWCIARWLEMQSK